MKRLQIDATVISSITNGESINLNRKLTYDDLKTKKFTITHIILEGLT